MEHYSVILSTKFIMSRILPMKNFPCSGAEYLTVEDAEQKARVSAFSEWMNDPSIIYHIDSEEIFHSSSAASYSQPSIHVPALGGLNLLVTSQGRIALGKKVQAGDVIALLSSCDRPFGLRPVP
jgi:hypothetical protein